jgi:hypothetical protein
MVTQDQLNQIRELAGLFFTIDEISMLVGIDREELAREIKFGHSEINNAYWIGKLEAMKTQRLQIVEWAKKGSPQAELQMVYYLQQMQESEKK